jgi:cytochrome c peroxidase
VAAGLGETAMRVEYRWLLSVVSILTLLGSRDSISRAQSATSTVMSPPGLTIEVLDSMTRLPGELSALPPPPSPSSNPKSQSKVELGRELFFDTRLSNDRTISCATCHDPSKSYSDGLARGVGINHAVLGRRTPSLLNSAYNSAQFWDGRAKTLEDQALQPMLGGNEMGLPNRQVLLARVRAIREYRGKFRLAFEQEASLLNIERAIAAFERTLTTPDSAFDRYAAGDKRALRSTKARLDPVHRQGSLLGMPQRPELYRQQVPLAGTVTRQERRVRLRALQGDQKLRRPPCVQDAKPPQRNAAIVLYARWVHV